MGGYGTCPSWTLDRPVTGLTFFSYQLLDTDRVSLRLMVTTCMLIWIKPRRSKALYIERGFHSFTLVTWSHDAISAATWLEVPLCGVGKKPRHFATESVRPVTLHYNKYLPWPAHNEISWAIHPPFTALLSGWEHCRSLESVRVCLLVCLCVCVCFKYVSVSVCLYLFVCWWGCGGGLLAARLTSLEHSTLAVFMLNPDGYKYKRLQYVICVSCYVKIEI